MCQRHTPMPDGARVDVTANVHVHGPAFELHRSAGLWEGRPSFWRLRVGDVDIVIRDLAALAQLHELTSAALATKVPVTHPCRVPAPTTLNPVIAAAASGLRAQLAVLEAVLTKTADEHRADAVAFGAQDAS